MRALRTEHAVCLCILLQRTRSLRICTIGIGEAAAFTISMRLQYLQYWATRMSCSRQRKPQCSWTQPSRCDCAVQQRSFFISGIHPLYPFLSFSLLKLRERKFTNLYVILIEAFHCGFSLFHVDRCIFFNIFFFSWEKALSTRWRQDTGSLCPPGGRWQSGTQNKVQTWESPGFYSSSTCRKRWRGWQRAAWWRGGQSHKTDHCCWLSPGQSC